MKTLYKIIEVLFCVSAIVFIALPKTSSWKDASAAAFALFGTLIVLVIVKTKKVHLFESIHFGKSELRSHDFNDD